MLAIAAPDDHPNCLLMNLRGLAPLRRVGRIISQLRQGSLHPGRTKPLTTLSVATGVV